MARSDGLCLDFSKSVDVDGWELECELVTYGEIEDADSGTYEDHGADVA